jgi:hypothetical protein
MFWFDRDQINPEARSRQSWQVRSLEIRPKMKAEGHSPSLSFTV